MAVTLALAGDTMLGRCVAERVTIAGPRTLFAGNVRDVVRAADLAIVNLECCVSDRGRPWPAPGKPFHFRAPPRAVEALTWLGVDCVTLANNHALDYGVEALADTRAHLASAGIQAVGAGPDRATARAPAMLDTEGLRVAVLAATDHPADFAAGPDRPGVAYADLDAGVPGWLEATVRQLRGRADIVLVTPHWGPNMTAEPVPRVRAAGPALVRAGATLVAGHSAHVFHGVAGPILYDLGDFVDDYAVHALRRNDLGLLFLATVDERGPVRLEAVPLALEFCHTRLARAPERAWIRDRFVAACAALGTEVTQEGQRLVIRWR